MPADGESVFTLRAAEVPPGPVTRALVDWPLEFTVTPVNPVSPVCTVTPLGRRDELLEPSPVAPLEAGFVLA
jgi:hypothetical protein